MKKRKQSTPEDNESQTQRVQPSDLSRNPGKTTLPLSSPMVTRRRFLSYAAGAGILAGMPVGILADDRRRPKKRHRHRRDTEWRTYVFNLSHMDTSTHDLILVAGKQRVPLISTTVRDRARIRRRHPILKAVPDTHMTHFISLLMPANNVQLCYVQRIRRSARDGNWDMALLFYHLPTASLRQAARRRRSLAAQADVSRRSQWNRRRPAGGKYGRPKGPRWELDGAVPVKWTRYGITPQERARLADHVGEDLLKDTTDQATALVVGYPELSSGEPDSAAHIQTNIVATQPETQTLGEVIESQGQATTEGGWATQTPLIDPETNQPYQNHQDPPRIS